MRDYTKSPYVSDSSPFNIMTHRYYGNLQGLLEKRLETRRLQDFAIELIAAEIRVMYDEYLCEEFDFNEERLLVWPNVLESNEDLWIEFARDYSKAFGGTILSYEGFHYQVLKHADKEVRRAAGLLKDPVVE